MVSEEFPHNPEVEFDPRSIAVVTATFYPNWNPDNIGSNATVDQIRGDLALHTIEAAKNQGFQVTVVDGAQNAAFKDAVTRLGVEPHPEIVRGMSRGRQQGFKEALQLEGVRAICWTEPEKESIARACLPAAALPILRGEADIVIPQRDAAGFASYPGYQVEFEQRANHVWNALLRKYGLRPEGSPDLDAWFGPRVFSPEVAELFLRSYEFDREGLDEFGLKYHNVIRPDLWPNATFLPIIAALHKGYRVVGVDVPYLHPAEQTASELDSAEFRRKRDVQYKGIFQTSSEYLKLITGGRPSRLSQAE